jgi:hypothetical protein
MTADEFPWLSALAEVARQARVSFEGAAEALGEVVLGRPDELHIHPSGTEFAGVHTVTLRRGGSSRTIQATAYLDAPTAPTRGQLVDRLGASEPLLVSPDQIGEFDYRLPAASEWQLPEQTSCIITVGRGDRVTAVALEVPRD